MVVPTQLAAVAALLEVVLVRILVVVAVAVVDILVADTVVEVVVVEAEVVPIHRIAVDTAAAVAAVAVVVAVVGTSPAEVDSNHPVRYVWSCISRFLESEQYLRFLFGENESPCGPPETAESPVSRNSLEFPCRDSTLFFYQKERERKEERKIGRQRDERWNKKKGKKNAKS